MIAGEQPSGTFWSSVINLITTGMGAGLLCLPWASSGASLVPALFIILAVLCLNYVTVMILVEAAERTGKFDLGALLRLLPGNLASLAQSLCNAVIWASMFLCLVAYFIVMADCGVVAFKESMGFDVKRVWVMLAASAFIMPLCFLSSDKLAYTSVFTVLSNLYIFGVMGYDLTRTMSAVASETLSGPPPCILTASRGIITMAAAMAQCVIVQLCSVCLYGDLKHRSPKKFSHIVCLSFSALFLLYGGYAVVGSVAYAEKFSAKPGDLAYPEDGTGNVLKLLSRGPAGIVAQGATVGAMITVYPVVMMPMVAPVRKSRFSKFSTPCTLLIGIGTFSTACALTNLQEVGVVNGSIAVIIFSGLIPAIAGYFFADRKALWMFVLAAGAATLGTLGLIFRESHPPEKCAFPAW